MYGQWGLSGGKLQVHFSKLKFSSRKQRWKKWVKNIHVKCAKKENEKQKHYSNPFI